MNSRIKSLKAEMKRQELLEILEYLEGLSQEEREAVEIQNLIGVCCFACGEFENAERFFVSALQKCPGNPEILNNLTEVRIKINQRKIRGLVQEDISEISSTVYDDLYENGGSRGTYRAHYKDSFYYPCWKTAMPYLYMADRSISILEIACGVGQFANMLFDNGFHNYVGFDFSSKGIMMAKQNNPQNSNRFYVADAFQTELVEKKYDLVICFEMLEHVKRDIELLNRIPIRTKLLLSVPNFDDPNHVRYFERIDDVVERYQNIVDIYDIRIAYITNANHLYYILGEKK